MTKIQKIMTGHKYDKSIPGGHYENVKKSIPGDKTKIWKINTRRTWQKCEKSIPGGQDKYEEPAQGGQGQSEKSTPRGQDRYEESTQGWKGKCETSTPWEQETY